MKQRPRRAGWSSQERPRLAGKGSDPTLRGPAWGVPGAHRTNTMLVHFRETPYGLAMSLVESRRENGKVRHEHLASLGSIETPPSVAARIEFWRRLHERLDQLSNRLAPETRGEATAAGQVCVPLVTRRQPA